MKQKNVKNGTISIKQKRSGKIVIDTKNAEIVNVEVHQLIVKADLKQADSTKKNHLILLKKSLWPTIIETISYIVPEMECTEVKHVILRCY